MSGFLKTLTGNTGGAVGPDGSNNINIVGAGAISVAGNPGTNTLTISIAGSGTATIVTTDATPTPFISVNVPAGRTVIITATIAATGNTGTASFGGTIALTVFRPTGGDVALVGFPTINSNTTSSANIIGTVDVGLEDAVIQVVGVAAQTWNWSATYQYFLV